MIFSNFRDLSIDAMRPGVLAATSWACGILLSCVGAQTGGGGVTAQTIRFTGSRLSDGTRRIEVFKDGGWGTVCDDQVGGVGAL